MMIIHPKTDKHEVNNHLQGAAYSIGRSLRAGLSPLAFFFELTITLYTSKNSKKKSSDNGSIPNANH